MKKLAKCILACVLTLCLLLGAMSPSVFAVTPVVYDFTRCQSSPANTTFDHTDNMWKYTSSWGQTTSTYIMKLNGGGVRLNFSSNVNTRKYSWFAFTITTPEEGTYNVQFTKAAIENTTGCKGGVIGVYILPVDTTFNTSGTNDAAFSSGTKLGAVDCTANEENTQTLSSWTVPADAPTTYLLAFRCEDGTNGAYGYLKAMTLTPVSNVASVGDQEFTSVAAAVTAAASTTDKTVTLIDNVTEDVVLTDGVTLDLAGNTLTGYVTAGGDAGNGKVIDSVGGGLVQCDKGDSLFNTDNGGYLPMYDSTEDNSGYRFFSYTAVSYAAKNDGNTADATETATFWFDIVFDKKDAYSLASDLKVGFKLDWTGNTATSGVEYFDEENYPVVSKWANAEKTAATENYAFYLNVKGIENTNLVAGDTVTVTPAATANGVEISFNAITYNVQ